MIGPREQRRTMARIDGAMRKSHPVTVTFLEVKKDADGKQMRFSDGAPVLVKTTRLIEPYEWYASAAGDISLRVADRTAAAREGLPVAYRTIRLDRVVRSRRRVLLTVHTSRAYAVTHPHLPARPSSEGVGHARPSPAAGTVGTNRRKR